MTYVDFSALKGRVPIADAVPRLGLRLQERGGQLRGPCPTCKSGGDRALVVTPAKQAFYCFGSRTGGDVIALAAHIRGGDMKAAAAFLDTEFSMSGRGRHSSPEERVKGSDQGPRVLKPLTYLEPKHDRVQALGIHPETCERFGAGYAPKGILRGRLAIPIHDWRSNELVAYCGRALNSEELTYTFPTGFDPLEHVFLGQGIGEGESPTLMHDPLEVMLAWQNGVDGGVAFLTETIKPQQLTLLATFMSERAIAQLDIA